MKQRTWLLLPIAFLWIGAAMPPKKDKALERLAKWLEGSFSTEAQAARDTNFYDIRLHMKRIWPERKGEYWLYVEQAMGERPERPYRQRVYRLYRGNGDTLVSAIYTFEKPLRYAGDFQKDKPLAALTPDSLQLRDGCEVYMVWQEAKNQYVGSSRHQTCASEIRGAKYATAEVVLTPESMTAWDRGFKEDGTQAWGSEHGGYQFVRRK